MTPAELNLELLLERFAPQASQAEATRASVRASGQDNDIARAQRRRALCEALQEAPPKRGRANGVAA